MVPGGHPSKARTLRRVKLARGLERRLEQLVDGIASTLFRGKVHPLELAARLIREADLAVTDGPGGPVAPNVFRVELGGETSADTDPAPAEVVLAEAVVETSLERGWRLEGPVSVSITVVPDERGVSVSTAVEPGPLEPWARLEPASDDPIPVRPNRAVVGRSGSSDVHLPDDDVSRTHALLWQEADRMWIADLESSNGTRLNGHLLAEPTELRDGDAVAFGDRSFRFRVA